VKILPLRVAVTLLCTCPCTQFKSRSADYWRGFRAHNISSTWFSNKKLNIVPREWICAFVLSYRSLRLFIYLFKWSRRSLRDTTRFS
jgi:hypothetical protein